MDKKSNSKGIKYIIELNDSIFPVLFITLLLLFLMETLWTNSVSAYMNLKYMTIITIISGFPYILNIDIKNMIIPEITWNNTVFSIIISTISIIVIYFKLPDISNSKIMIALLSGLLLFIVSILFYDIKNLTLK